MTASGAGCLGDDGDDDDDADANDENDDDDGNDTDGFEIDPGTPIVFDGYIEMWEGVEPASIEGEANPTLILEDGGDYEIEWVNADGSTHNLEIRNEDDEIVDDLVTDDVGTVDDGDSLSFTATEEMMTYICKFHVTSQLGELIVR